MGIQTKISLKLVYTLNNTKEMLRKNYIYKERSSSWLLISITHLQRHEINGFNPITSKFSVEK